jgi:hypothetical protein
LSGQTRLGTIKIILENSVFVGAHSVFVGTHGVFVGTHGVFVGTHSRASLQKLNKFGNHNEKIKTENSGIIDLFSNLFVVSIRGL